QAGAVHRGGSRHGAFERRAARDRSARAVTGECRAVDRVGRRVGGGGRAGAGQADALRGARRGVLVFRFRGASQKRDTLLRSAAKRGVGGAMSSPLEPPTPRPLAPGAVTPACPLALTAERRLDERRQRALVRYYLAAGATGLAVGVHTTQFAIR